MTAETTIPEQARPAGARAPSPATEIGANGSIVALSPGRPQARNATGDAMRAEPARKMVVLEVPQ